MPPTPVVESVAFTVTDEVGETAPKSAVETAYWPDAAVPTSRPLLSTHDPLDAPVNLPASPSSKYSVASTVLPVHTDWTAMLSISPRALFEPKPTKPLLSATLVPSSSTRGANV